MIVLKFPNVMHATVHVWLHGGGCLHTGLSSEQQQTLVIMSSVTAECLYPLANHNCRATRDTVCFLNLSLKAAVLLTVASISESPFFYPRRTGL